MPENGDRDRLYFPTGKEQDAYAACAYIDHVEGTAKIHLEAKSGSYRLNQVPRSGSFQDGNETYAKIVQDVAGREGGRVICAEGRGREIGKSFIRYGETAWEFCKHLASRLGTL